MAKSKHKKSPVKGSRASQVYVPPHLSEWPRLKIPVPADPQPAPKPAKKLVKDRSNGEESGGFSSVRQEGHKTNGFHGVMESNSDSSSGESEYNSAEKAPASKCRKEVVQHVKEESARARAKPAASHEVDTESSSGAESASEDAEDNSIEEELAGIEGKGDKKQATPSSSKRRLSIPSKEKLKNAVAERHDENKKKGFKTSVGANVFNARSPAIAIATPARSPSADKASERSKGSNSTKLPAKAPIPPLKTERSDASPPPPPQLRKALTQPSYATPIPVPITDGPNPPPPSKQADPGKKANGCSSTLLKSAPQLERRDSFGRRTFSSSIFTKESSPESESKEPESKPKVKISRKKEKMSKTGGDVVLAEARKQAERLRQLDISKETRDKEGSCPVQPGVNEVESHGDKTRNIEQPITVRSTPETASASGGGSSNKKVKVEKKEDKSPKRKHRVEEQRTKSSKKQKQIGRDNIKNDDPVPAPQGSKKSKKRKWDTYDDRVGDDAGTPENAKKNRADHDGRHDGDTGAAANLTESKDSKKKKKKKKRKREDQQDEATNPADGEPSKSQKHFSRPNEQQSHPPENAPAAKKSKKEKKMKQSTQNIADVHPSRHRQITTKQSGAVNATQHTSDPNDAVLDTRLQSALAMNSEITNPDMTSLLTHLKLLLPRSALESALAKLNSDNKDVCSQRKLQYIQKPARKKHDIPARNVANYAVDDDVTVLTAARDLIVSLSRTRLGVDLVKSTDPTKQDGAIGIHMSPMELELGRIAMGREWENERLREQVMKLQARVQRLQEQGDLEIKTGDDSHEKSYDLSHPTSRGQLGSQLHRREL